MQATTHPVNQIVRHQRNEGHLERKKTKPDFHLHRMQYQAEV